MSSTNDKLFVELLLAFLGSLNQGRDQFYAALEGLGHPFASPRERIVAREIAGQLDALRALLATKAAGLGAPLCSSSSEAAIISVNLLREFKHDLLELANELTRMLGLRDLPTRTGDIAFLAAGFRRSAAQRLLYSKELDRLSRAFPLEPVLRRAESAHNDAIEEERLSNEIYVAVKRCKGRLDPRILDAYGSRWISISGKLRAVSHEINRLLYSTLLGDLDFSHAEFRSDEVLRWRSEGFKADEAGFWRAYGISPELAREWLSISITDPAHAASWHYQGFSPRTSKPWRQYDIPAFAARKWLGAGYSAVQADKQIKLGFYLPEAQVENVGTAESSSG